MTPAELDALEARLRERAETWREVDYAAAAMDVYTADAIRSLRAELTETQTRTTNTIASLQTIARAALIKVAKRDARIATALGRLRAASVPLGMSTEQFQAHTIRDACAILSESPQNEPWTDPKPWVSANDRRYGSNDTVSSYDPRTREQYDAEEYLEKGI